MITGVDASLFAHFHNATVNSVELWMYHWLIDSNSIIISVLGTRPVLKRMWIASCPWKQCHVKKGSDGARTCDLSVTSSALQPFNQATQLKYSYQCKGGNNSTQRSKRYPTVEHKKTNFKSRKDFIVFTWQNAVIFVSFFLTLVTFFFILYYT